MFGQDIREDVTYLIIYGAATATSLIACLYLLFRRTNTIAPEVTPPIRLRRWTAAFMAACALSHFWYLPLLYIRSAENLMTAYFIGALLDFLTVFPLASAIMFIMLQDRRRPLWPIAVAMAPLVVVAIVCIATRSNAILPPAYAYFLLLCIVLVLYMTRAVRQYGRWLRDNYADLEHKEVWQSMIVLAVILAGFSLYMFELEGTFFRHAMQTSVIIVVCFLVWRVETLSDLSAHKMPAEEALPLPDAEDTPLSCHEGAPLSDADETSADSMKVTLPQDLTTLLQKHCIDTQLYLQHDLTIQQLAKTIGTNRFYLSQYFSQQGITYNDYINGLRIDHFVAHYHEIASSHHSFTVKQLAIDSGYRNYTTFSTAFKRRMGKNVTAWMQEPVGGGEL